MYIRLGCKRIKNEWLTIITSIGRRYLFLFGGNIAIGRGSVIKQRVSIGTGTRINGYSYLTACTIGKYCGIGENFQVRSSNHDITSLALQEHFVREVAGTHSVVGVSKSGVKLGDNCWVGVNVTLLDGANVGHSSIIAAGSVVNKEFPPFSIIGGVPAKLLRYRGSAEARALLADVSWWDWPVDEIRRCKHLFTQDIDKIDPEIICKLKNTFGSEQ